MLLHVVSAGIFWTFIENVLQIIVESNIVALLWYSYKFAVLIFGMLVNRDKKYINFGLRLMLAGWTSI